MTYISCFSDFAFYFYYYFMENCHTWIIISMWQNDLHTNTSRSVWPILYGLMIKMLQYKMYPAGELLCPTTALVWYSTQLFVLWPVTILFGCHGNIKLKKQQHIFMPPHRMMQGGISDAGYIVFSVFHTWVCVYECMSFCMNVTYVCMWSC